MFRAAIPLAVLLLLPFWSGCGTSGSKVPVSEMTARTNPGGVQMVDVDEPHHRGIGETGRADVPFQELLRAPQLHLRGR